jgi:DNA polymerase III subunit delta
MKKKSPSTVTSEARDSLFLIYGDEFLVKEQVKRLTADLLEPEFKDTNLIVLDGANLDLSMLSLHLFTPTLFGGSRLIVVDQTTLFMGRADQRKLVEKTVGAWKAGEKKSALRSLAQLINLAGLDSRDLESGSDWLNAVLTDTESHEDREILATAARALVEDGAKVRSVSDEAFVEELISSPLPEGTALVFTAPAVDKRKKIFQALQKRGSVVECAVREEKYGAGLDRSFFDRTVREILGAAGKKISGDAVAKIYSGSGKDVRRLHSELDKLIGYVGARPQVTAQDVEAVFSDFHEAAFFDLANALRTADIKKCLPALHENLKISAHPLQTLGAIASEFRKLMAARELLFTVFRSSWRRDLTYDKFQGEARKVREANPGLTGKGKFRLLSMKDYPLYLLLKESQRFPLEKLIRIIEATLEADVLMKSSRLGRTGPEAILEQLIFTICEP